MSLLRDQIRKLQERLDFIEDSKIFQDPDLRSSFGSAHVSHQALVTSSSKKPSRDSKMQRNTREAMSIPGNVFDCQSARRVPEELHNDSRNLATPLGIQRREGFEKSGSEESLQPIPLPCFFGASGKFPDHTEFQSWIVNFRVEVCAKAKNPTLALQWIKEIEAAKSLDDLVTLKSITGKYFPDYEELDTTMAAALKRCYDKQTQFRKKISVEEQRAQEDNRFLRGRQIAYLISEYFRPLDSIMKFKDHWGCSVLNC